MTTMTLARVDHETAGPTKGDDRGRVLNMMEIDRQTRLGSEEIKMQRMDLAIDHLANAYQLSRQLNDDVTERACAFNLGAAYITSKQAEKGLDYLQRAVPPMNKRDGISNGDLFQNFAIGYEMLNKAEEMVHYFQLALQEYRRENLGPNLEISISIKIANALASMNEFAKAADAYGQLAQLYEKVGNHGAQADALLRRSKLLSKCGDSVEQVKCLSQCLQVCHLVLDVEKKGGVLEDLGLAYSQTKQYDEALLCFQEELLLIQNNPAYKERQAITLQNLGAIQNSRAAYQEALSHHRAAAKIFGELGKRKNQGHCFVNLAYAHARLGDMDGAGEAYLHALLAARDSRDKKAEWQAAEGLAAVVFLRGQTDKAIQYYKEALAALAGMEQETKSQERIVAKLTDALQCKVTASNLNSARSSAASTHGAGVPKHMPGKPTSQPVVVDTRSPVQNGEQPIVPSRVEAVGAQAPRSERTTPSVGRTRVSQTDPRYDENFQESQEVSGERRQSDVVVRVNSVQRNISHEIQKPAGPLKRRQGGSPEGEPHSRQYKFSLGIGDYESDSDKTVSSGDERRRSSASADQLSEEMDGMLKQFRDKQSEYKRNRPSTARNDRRDGEPAPTSSKDPLPQDEVDTSQTSEGSTDTESNTEQEDTDKRISTRRQNKHASLRQDQTIITVGDSWESDLEWKNQAAKFLDSKSASNSGNTDSSAGFHHRAPGGKPGKSVRHVTYQSLSSSASDLTSVTESNSDLDESNHSRPLSETPKPQGKRPIKKDLLRRPIGKKQQSQNDETPILEQTEPIQVATSPQKQPEVELSSAKRADDNESLKSEEIELPDTKVKSDDKDDRRYSVDSEGVVTSPPQQVTSPPQQARHLKAVMKLRESFGNQTPTGSEADDSTYATIEEASTSGVAPKDPLENTYQQPETHHGNFFQADEATELKDSEESETESESADSLNEEEEALYATIGEPEPSTSQTQVFKSPSRSTSSVRDLDYTGPLSPPPDVPAHPEHATEGMQMSFAEREQFLFEYQRKRDEILRREQEENLAGDQPSDPRRAKKSALCIVM